MRKSELSGRPQISRKRGSTGLVQWWPSRYGPKDVLGAMNELTYKKVLDGLELVGNGCVYDLATDYDRANPGTPSSFWESSILATGILTSMGKNSFQSMEEVFSGCPGRGSHLVGLAHLSINGTFYSGFKMSDVFDVNGVMKFGVEYFRPLVTRGVLIDMVEQKGRPLEAGEAVTVFDIESFLKKKNIDVRPGDAVLIRTGWHRHFNDGQYVGPEPGINKKVAKWLYDKHVVVVGTDNWATEQVPGDNPKEVMPVQQLLLCRYGIYLFQFGVFDELAMDRLYEFCFVFTCPKIRGSTQGIGRPIAIGNGPQNKIVSPPTIHSVEQGKWYPTRYGAGDELGSENEITSAKIVEAIKVVKEGKIYDLGLDYDEKTPATTNRFWHTRIINSFSPCGTNKLLVLDDLLIGSALGTHTDGLAHVAVKNSFYNGFSIPEVIKYYKGLVKFGVDRFRPMVTRAIFIDMQKEFGHPLEGGEQIGVSHIEHYLKVKRLEVKPGDALLIRTGWHRFYPTARYMGKVPGITKAIADWANDKRVVLIGLDTFCTEVYPGEDSAEVMPVHILHLVRYGIRQLQLINLEEMAKDEVDYCLFINLCPKIRNCTQGIGRPIVIK